MGPHGLWELGERCTVRCCSRLDGQGGIRLMLAVVSGGKSHVDPGFLGRLQSDKLSDTWRHGFQCCMGRSMGDLGCCRSGGEGVCAADDVNVFSPSLVAVLRRKDLPSTVCLAPGRGGPDLGRFRGVTSIRVGLIVPQHDHHHSTILGYIEGLRGWICIHS